MHNIYVGILSVSTIYLIMISILFHVKLKQKTIENSIYKDLIIINIFSILIEALLFILAPNYGSSQWFDNSYLLIGKIFVCSILTWTVKLLVYTFFLGKDDNNNEHKQYKVSNTFSKNKKWHRIMRFLYYIIVIVVLLLPMNFYRDDEQKIGYTEGPAVNIGFSIIFLIILTMIIYLIKVRKILKIKKAVPVFLFVFLFLLATITQIVFPEMLLFNPVLSFITVLMYHTIENPDIKLIKALNIANEQAIRANNAKSNFLSSMSHEIRTPLNAIIGFSESIKLDSTLEEAKDDASDIIMASNNLLEIINGILNISKIEANKMEIVEVNYKPLDIFNNLSKLIKSRIMNKPIEFITNFSPEIPDILNGDVSKIKEVITNLLTNAAKYTDKGTIIFSVQCVNKKGISKILISVKDTGKGIKEEDLKKLFTKFERLDEVKNSNIEGTGLGLSIAKSLVELMGGKIQVTSKYGKGSEFKVFLQQEIIMPHTTDKVEDTDKKEDNNICLENKKLLIVDDSSMNLKVACRILKTYNLDIDCVSSGQECIDKINLGNKYDLIFMDDMMPNMSGTQALGKLKKIKEFNAPVVVLTANAIEGEREKYLEKGFNDYLSKPIERSQINKILKKFLT